MAHVSKQNDKYLRKRNAKLIKHYKSVIGAPKLAEVALIVALELLCLAADLTAYGQMFGQVMGDAMGTLVAAAVSLLFPLMAYLCFRGMASRFRDRKDRERLSLGLLAAMAVFLLVSLVIRFPLEAAATSDEGANWLIGACVYCLPAISSVLGSLAAALTLHNPETEEKTRAAMLRARISTLKAEIATLKGNDPQLLRQHLDNIYRSAYFEVDGLMNCAIAESVSSLVAHQGLLVHDHFGRLLASSQVMTAQYDSRPPEFAPKPTPTLANESPAPELQSPKASVLPGPERLEATNKVAS